jgi:hypothetical protein
VTMWWEGHAPIVFHDSEVIADLPALPYLHCKVLEIFDKPAPQNDVPVILRVVNSPGT